MTTLNDEQQRIAGLLQQSQMPQGLLATQPPQPALNPYMLQMLIDALRRKPEYSPVTHTAGVRG